jgi:hypothetical protein
MSGRRQTQTFFTAYGVQAKPAALSPPSAKQLQIHSVTAENRSGGLSDVGILRKYGSSKYLFGKLVVAGNPDLTDVDNLYFEANNDGFLVQAKQPFGLVGLEVTVGAGAAGVYSFEYFNGTSYVAIGSVILSPTYTATGSQIFSFAPPVDWALGGEAGVGADGTKYSIRIRSTTAPATPMTATSFWVAEFLAFKSALADDGVLSLDYPDDSPLVFDAEEGIMPYFAVANAGNLVTIIYSVIG